MKYSRNRAALAVVVILVFILALLPIAGLVSLVQAAVPWTKYLGDVTLKYGTADELFVVNAWVIKDGSTYKMWYTHSKTDMDIGAMIDSLTSILTRDIISDLVNLDFDKLLDDLSLIDAATLWDFLNATSTVIGYATSIDGKVWTVENEEVLAGDGGELESVGMPCVIKTVDGYEMWFTHSKTDLTQPELESILPGLGGDTDARKTAILALLDATSTSIGYATSTDGEDWGTPDFGVLTSTGSGIWHSVANPCVIKNGASDYDMWFTYNQISLDETELTTILTNIDSGSFDTGDLWVLLDDIQSTIGHATSANGTAWENINLGVFSGGTGLWNSVATPCVIKNGSSYEMWYTHLTTDLDSTSFQELMSEIQALGPDISDLLDSYTTGGLTAFLEDLKTFLGDPDPDEGPPIPGDIDPILPYLANTSARIGYATSGDGIMWVEQNPTALTGSSGSPWSSVASPCVVWEGGVYEMWFTQGVEYPSAQNLVSLMDGSILPIGYAIGFNLVAETSASPDKDTDEIVVVDVKIVQGKDSYTGLQADIPGGVSEFTAIVTGDPVGIDILEVRSVAPFDSLSHNLEDYPTTGTFTISWVASTPIQPSNTTVFKLVTRLIGDALTPYDLTVAFQTIGAAGYPGMNVLEENSNTITFKRGDTTGEVEGVVSIADAFAIALYLVDRIDLEEINSINAASVVHEVGNGDKISISDAFAIALYLVDRMDENFEPIP